MKKKAIILLTGALILTGCGSFDEGSFPNDIENTENNTTVAVETEAARPVPAWLEKDADKLSGKVIRLAAREDIDLPVEEHLIVELYSR